MSQDKVLTIILIVVLLYGFWSGWRQITNGNGLLGSRLPQKTLEWLNRRKAGSIIVKLGISLVLAYIFAVLSFLKLILIIINFIFRQ